MENQDTNKDAVSPTGDGAEHARVAARRRFLKGTSLALPAVMTLHSVSAQAQARQSAYCANDINQSAAQPTIPSTATDDYFRKSVNVYAKLIDDGSGTYVSDGQPTYFLGSSGSTDVWRKVADGQPVPTAEIPFINASINGLRATPTSDPGSPLGTVKAIVHFDSTSGAVVSVGAPNGENLNAMVTSLTGACLHSLWGQTV
jgi:hypothetical protein